MHARQIDDDRAFDRQDTAVAGGRRSARDELEALLGGEADDRDDLCLGQRPDDSARETRGHERLHQLGHLADVGGVHPPLDAVGPDPVADDAAQPGLGAFVHYSHIEEVLSQSIRIAPARRCASAHTKYLAGYESRIPARV